MTTPAPAAKAPWAKPQVAPESDLPPKQNTILHMVQNLREGMENDSAAIFADAINVYVFTIDRLRSHDYTFTAEDSRALLQIVELLLNIPSRGRKTQFGKEEKG